MSQPLSREDVFAAVALHAGLTYAFTHHIVTSEDHSARDSANRLEDDLRNAVTQAPSIARHLISLLDRPPNAIYPQSGGTGQKPNIES